VHPNHFDALMAWYVDEDAHPPKYYMHMLGTTKVATKDGEYYEGFEEQEHGSFLKIPDDLKGKPFKDNQLLRVQERGKHGFLEHGGNLQTDATRSNWFELAVRFGQEITPEEWTSTYKDSQKRMVKLLGFDGASPMDCPLLKQATEQLKDEADLVIWDGDWYGEQGWTNMIRVFLEHNENNIAVAFQKRGEVPGFHRSYWRFYKDFPERLKIVVLEDEEAASQVVKKQLDWLNKLYEDGFLLRPEGWQGNANANRYVEVSLLGRQLQGPVSVIALNGGRITSAQAAVDTLMSGSKNSRWTVYPAERRFEGRGVRVPTPYSTLIEFAEQNPSRNMKMVQALHTSTEPPATSTTSLIERIQPDWHKENTFVNREFHGRSKEVVVPDYAYTAEAAQLYNKKYASDYVSITDYCGPAHSLSRYTALILYGEMVLQFLFSWFYPDAPSYECIVWLGAAVCLAMMEFRMFQWISLPLQEHIKKLSLPLGINVPFTIWWMFYGGLSCLGQISSFANAKLAGQSLGSQQGGIFLISFIMMFVAPAHAMLFHMPTQRKFEYPENAPTNCLGKDIGAFSDQKQDVKYNFGRQVDKSGHPKCREEFRFSRWAQFFGLDDWDSTHYEALLSWAQASQLNMIAAFTCSSQKGEFDHFNGRLKEFAKDGNSRTRSTMEALRCIRRAVFAGKQGFYFLLLIGFCRSSLQILTQGYVMPSASDAGGWHIITYGLAILSAALSEFCMFLDVKKFMDITMGENAPVENAVKALQNETLKQEFEVEYSNMWEDHLNRFASIYGMRCYDRTGTKIALIQRQNGKVEVNIKENEKPLKFPLRLDISRDIESVKREWSALRKSWFRLIFLFVVVCLCCFIGTILCFKTAMD